MAHPHENRDVMIAFIVGGLGLILILLYMFNGAAPAGTNADGEALPTVTSTAPRGASAYNYNIAPYNPDPGLTYGKSSLPDYTGDGCCNKCGPLVGNQYNNVSVAQFMTLAGFGADGGAA